MRWWSRSRPGRPEPSTSRCCSARRCSRSCSTCGMRSTDRRPPAVASLASCGSWRCSPGSASSSSAGTCNCAPDRSRRSGDGACLSSTPPWPLAPGVRTFDASLVRCYKTVPHRPRFRLSVAVPRASERMNSEVTFPEIDAAAQTPAGQTRLKRQLAEQAIAQATDAAWADAAETNRRLLELAADSEAENRLAKALWELGELGSAREHYQKALALDPTNRIAERNIDRLKVLLVEAGEKTVPAKPGSKAPVSIFVEETGKTGFAHLTNLARSPELAQVNPGALVELIPEGNRLAAISNGVRIGIVEPRVAARLLKLMADGNKYLAGVTSLGDKDVRLIIREVFQDPRNYGKVSFPTAAKSTDLRPYTKGTLVREDEELEDDLEDDVEDEEIENFDRVLPPEETTDEAFVEETDELEEP